MRLANITVLILSMAFASSGEGAAPELITVPAEATIEIEGKNYANAREKAIQSAFMFATRMAVAGLTTPEEMEGKKELMEARIVSRGRDFVKSYKFLDEAVDPTKRFLAIRLQVTLFLDDVRKAMRNANVRLKKRNLPKLIIVMEEKNIGFFESENFLLLKSLSEEILENYFRQRGYQVISRKSIIEARLVDLARDAHKLNTRAIRRLARFFEADLLILGRIDVEARPSVNGENIKTDINLSLVFGENGAILSRHSDVAVGVYDHALSGSLEAIGAVTQKVAKQLVLVLPRTWEAIKAAAYE